MRRRRRLMKKAALTMTLFWIGVLSGWAQAAGAPPQGTTVPPVGSAQLGNCIESICRNAPVRETISEIDLHLKHVKGMLGGFQQGGGIGAGVQLTTADA